jgi:hypothetical protein
MPPAVKRRLATLAAAASLLVCIATVVVWVRSWNVYDALFCDRSSSSIQIESLQGELLVGVCDCVHVKPGSGWYHSSTSPRLFPDFRLHANTQRSHVLGVRSASSRTHGMDVFVTGTWLKLPLWLPAVAAALFPGGVALIRLSQRLRRSRASHYCSACGYDLRATPERCPECGAAPAEMAAR